MNTLNKEHKMRPEAIKIINEINLALTPIMNKAFKYGFSPDAFTYMVTSEVIDMISFYTITVQNKEWINGRLFNHVFKMAKWFS